MKIVNYYNIVNGSVSSLISLSTCNLTINKIHTHLYIETFSMLDFFWLVLGITKTDKITRKWNLIFFFHFIFLNSFDFFVSKRKICFRKFVNVRIHFG